MPKIKLIALDLDGTLLNSRKELTERTVTALERAARSGIEIVPCTGRFFGGMPEAVRALDFVNYAITINGAQVYDIRDERAVYEAEIPAFEAVKIMRYLDDLPVIYDCYMENWGVMTRALQEKAAEFAPDEHYLKMIRELRTPVPDLKEYVIMRGRGVQKIQLFTKDMALRERLFTALEEGFSDIVTSSSVPNNIEINNVRANKGDALSYLAYRLGLDRAETMSFGDGLNDIPMLTAAGTGVAMQNAAENIKAAADAVCGSNDEDGVAEYIEKMLERE